MATTVPRCGFLGKGGRAVSAGGGAHTGSHRSWASVRPGVRRLDPGDGHRRPRDAPGKRNREALRRRETKRNET